MLSGNDTKFILKWLKEELGIIITNIVAQLVQSRSRMLAIYCQKKSNFKIWF